jgi:uncharacterized spore protein YtfJ
MSFNEVLEHAGKSLGVKRVYGEPYEKNGVTIIPAARVMGGFGGGGERVSIPTGIEDGGDVATGVGAGGMGGGWGLVGWPVGAYVIKGDSVRWVPAVDVNRLMFGMQLVLIVFFLAWRSVAKARANRVS